MDDEDKNNLEDHLRSVVPADLVKRTYQYSSTKLRRLINTLQWKKIGN